MAILNLKEKVEWFRKSATGYVKMLLSSNHVYVEGKNQDLTEFSNIFGDNIRKICAGVKLCDFKNGRTITFLSKNELSKILKLPESDIDLQKISVTVNVLTNQTQGYLRTPYMYPNAGIAVSSTEIETRPFNVSYIVILRK